MADRLPNHKLLELPEQLLGWTDRDRQRILRGAAMEMPCPNCGVPLNHFDALRITLDEYDTDALRHGPYTCPNCQRELLLLGPLSGPQWEWVLVRLLTPLEETGEPHT